MRILYYANFFPPNTGAAALNTLTIAKFLVNYGHKLMILTPTNMGRSLNLKNSTYHSNTPDMQIFNSSKIIKLPFSWIFSHFENIGKFLLNLRKKFEPDLILSQYHAFHYASVAGTITSRALKIPHIIRSHDIFLDLESHSLPFNLFNNITYPQIYQSIKKCREFYVVSSELKEYLSRFKKLKDVNFKIHHNGIDTSLFNPIKNQEVLKEKYGCETLISFIGLISEDVGIHNFLIELPRILKNHKDTHFLLLGEGSYKDTIIKLIKKLQIAKNVHIIGTKAHRDIPFFINNCDFGIGKVTTSKLWTYSIPIKCLEYMACKKPFISTPLSKDVIKDNDVGLIINRNFNRKELFDKIITLIEDNKLRLKLGENGLQKINQSFKWEVLMENFNKNLLNSIK